MRRFFKWVGIVILSITLIAVVILSIIGIPKPSSITTENVPRLPLKHVAQMYQMMETGLNTAYFARWNPEGDGYYLWKKDESNHWSLYHSDLVGQSIKPIVGLPEDASNVLIQPNGENIIYLMDHNGDENWKMYLLNRQSQETTEIATSGIRAKRLNKEGDELIFLSNSGNSKDRELYFMTLDNPESLRKLKELQGLWTIKEWIEESNIVVLSQFHQMGDSDVYFFDLETGELLNFDPAKEFKANYGRFLWDSSINSLYYTSDKNSEFLRLHSYDISTGKDSILTETLNWDITNFDVSPDGKWIALTVNEEGSNQGYTLQVQSGTIQKISGLPYGSFGNIQFNPNDHRLLINHKNLSGDWSIYLFDISNKAVSELAKSKSEESALFPDPKLIRYPTFDYDSLNNQQRLISSFLHMPVSDPEGKLPVVIIIHGGPMAQADAYRNPVINLALKNNMAVLVPNVRGSTGYGKTFETLDNGVLRLNAVKDIGALLDWIETQPTLDKNRVAVYGASYGGFMSLACAVQYSDKLKCAIDLFGPSNIITNINGTKNFPIDVKRAEYGDEQDPEIRKILESISPVNNVDKIKIPILIYQGANDIRILPRESQQMFDALKANQKNPWYIYASNEGHGLTDEFNTIYVGAACLEFLKQHLHSD